MDAADCLEALPRVELERPADVTQGFAPDLPDVPGQLGEHAARDAELGFAAELGQQALVIIGRQLDVAVELAHVREVAEYRRPWLNARASEACHSRSAPSGNGSGGAAITRMNGICDAARLQDLARAVGRAVVHDDPLVGRARLRPYRADDRLDVPGLVS